MRVYSFAVLQVVVIVIAIDITILLLLSLLLLLPLSLMRLIDEVVHACDRRCSVQNAFLIGTLFVWHLRRYVFTRRMNPCVTTPRLTATRARRFQ